MMIERPVLWRIPVMTVPAERIQELADTLDQRLSSILARHADVRFATSLAAEDMVLTDAIARSARGIRLFTLATGRLHQETLDMVDQVWQHYQLPIRQVRPDEAEVAGFIDQYGLDGFYESEDAKKTCCGVRKVRPLNRALTGARAWISGQRRGQAMTREALQFEEFDDSRQIPKFNPLYDWSEAEVWSYLQCRDVPINPLHRRGYPSIGCEPCTRAIRAGEDVRAGRWWWLHQESKECGLHVAETAPSH